MRACAYANPRVRTVLVPPVPKTIERPVRPSFLWLVVDNTKSAEVARP